MKSLLIRTLTGLLFIAVIIASILFSDVMFNKVFSVLFNVFLLFTCLALYEYRSLLQRQKINLSIFFYIVSLLVYFMLSYTNLWGIGTTITLLLIILGLFFLLFIVELFRKQENPFTRIAYSVLGIVWIVLPFALINHIPFMFVNGKYLLLTIFAFVWLYDTLAYCIGSIWGRHRLTERISPKKSWEGMIGAALLTVGVASLMPQLFPIFSLTVSQWTFFALIIVVFATIGDLVESLLKRQFSIKDSGNILPGHGGVLDRFDSIFFVIPFITLYLISIL